MVSDINHKYDIICIFNKICVLIGKMLYIIGSQLFVSYKKIILEATYLCTYYRMKHKCNKGNRYNIIFTETPQVVQYCQDAKLPLA